MKVTKEDIQFSIDYAKGQMELIAVPYGGDITKAPQEVANRYQVFYIQYQDLRKQLWEFNDVKINNRPIGKPVNRYKRKTNVSA